VSILYKIFAFIGVPQVFLVDYSCLPLRPIFKTWGISITPDLSYYNLPYTKSLYIDVLNKNFCGLREIIINIILESLNPDKYKAAYAVINWLLAAIYRKTIKDILELALNTGKLEYIYAAMNSTLLAALYGLWLSTPKGKGIFIEKYYEFKRGEEFASQMEWWFSLAWVIDAIIDALSLLGWKKEDIKALIKELSKHPIIRIIAEVLSKRIVAGILSLILFILALLEFVFSNVKEDYKKLATATEYSFNPRSIEVIISLAEVDLAIFKYLVTKYYQMK